MILVNPETGEQMFNLKQGDTLKLIRKNTKKYLDEKIKPLSKNYTKINNDEFTLLNNELLANEKIFLLSISSYINYENNKIKYNNQYNIKLIDFVNITNLSEKTIRITIDNLINKMIIYKDKKEYYINPWLMSKGKMIDKNLFYLFSDYKIRSKDNIEWKHLK